jgi:hypothetical protein
MSFNSTRAVSARVEPSNELLSPTPASLIEKLLHLGNSPRFGLPA